MQERLFVMTKIITDELSLYRGRPHQISEHITVRMPTLGEICDYGEAAYYSMVHALTSVGIDLCWQLEEMGIRYDEISDFQLFSGFLCRQYDTARTRILFGDTLNFQAMELINAQDGSSYLRQKVPRVVPSGTGPAPEGDPLYDELIIDEAVYHEMIGYLRAMHDLKRDDRVAGTDSCRRAFIEDAKMEYLAKKSEPAGSVLLPMISTMVNTEGFKRDDTTVWDMNIFAFMDSVKRTSKIRNATLLLQSGYSGFGIDLKKLNKDEINYMGALR